MIELTDREREEDIIELASEKPKINALSGEINQALTDLNGVYSRWDNCADYWHARWEGQSADGLKHAGFEDLEDPFPWDGASDIRSRDCERGVRQHVMVSKIAWYESRLQAEALQPAIDSREASQGTKLLKWMVGTHMADNVRREVPLYLTWRFAYGACLMAVEWEQEERIDEHRVDIGLLANFLQMSGAGPNVLFQLQGTISDPAWEENYIALLMQLSDVLTRRTARAALQDLRTLRFAMLPVRYTFKSQPRWTAKRIGVDVLFNIGVRDLQCAPLVTDREWVSRPELLSRVRKRGYDPKFVEELLKHKGETTNADWVGRTFAERAYVTSGYTGNPNWDGSFRNMYELYHARYRASESGSTCMYETVFNPNAVGRDREKPLYAVHEKFNYDHGKYPYVVGRMEHTDGPIYSSEGIPEKAYTWERGKKVQLDGNTDLTALELGPPLIVPKSRSGTLGGYPLPRAVLPVDRASDYQFMQLPPAGVRSAKMIEEFRLMMAEFFPLFDPPGIVLDPELKLAYRKELVSDILAESCQVGEMTFQLLQQFEANEEVQAVVGTLRRPFHVSKQEIQQAHRVTATYNVRQLGLDYAKETLPLIQLATGLDQSGRYDMSEVAAAALEIIDPAFMDRIARPMEEATQMELKDELSAINAAFNGMEIPPPMHGNHQLRLQTLLQATLQSQNPRMSKRLADNPDTSEILQKRAEFYQNQIQQHSPQGNPQIGRTLATSAFNQRQALPTTAQSTGGGY